MSRPRMVDDARRDAETVAVALPRGLLREAAAAAEQMPYVLDASEKVFDLIRSGIGSGWFDADNTATHVGPLAELCAIALRALADREGEAMARLALHLKAAMEADAGGDAPDEGPESAWNRDKKGLRKHLGKGGDGDAA